MLINKELTVAEPVSQGLPALIVVMDVFFDR